MTRSEKTFGFLLVAIIGAWGCAKNPTDGSTGKNSSLEAKAQRLEEDFRAAASARDQFRQKLNTTEEKLATAESRNAQLQSQYDETRVQRDGLRADLQTRTTERDALATQYESFRMNIKNLLGKAESALANPATAPPVAVSSQPATPEGGSALRN